MAEFFRRDLPAPGYDNTDRASIQGLRGIVLNPDSLSGGAVQLDARGVQAMGEGAARFGQGVAAVGSDLMAVANEQARAIAIHQETDAENQMADTEGRIQVAITEQPDETKWRGIADQHISSFEESLNGREMTAAARDAIRMKVAGWKNQVGHFVGMASARRSVERAREGIQAKAMRMMAAGDYGGLNTMLNQPGTTHFMGEAWVAGQQVAAVKQAKEKEKEAKWAAEYGLIQKGPDAYLHEHGAQRLDETPEEHMHRIGVAERAAADKFQERSNGIADALSSPDFKPSELPALLEGLPPRIAAKWKAAYADSQDEKMKAIHADPRYINATWGKLDDMVQSFDRKAPDARERYSEIRALALTLPEGWRQHPLAALDAKWSAKPPDPDKAIESELDDSIDGVYKAGGFGPVARPVTEGLNPTSGQWEKAQDGVEYLRKREGKEPLPEDQIQGARSAKAALKIHVREYLKRNPGATPEDAFKALNDMRDRQRDKAAPSVNFAPSAGFVAPPVADAPAVLDSVTGPAPSELPSGPTSGPSTSLLPNPPPDAAGGGAMWVADKKGNTTEVTPMTDEDVTRWRAAGDSASKVWDLEKSQWVMRKPSELEAGKYAMPTNLFPQ